MPSNGGGRRVTSSKPCSAAHSIRGQARLPETLSQKQRKKNSNKHKPAQGFPDNKKRKSDLRLRHSRCTYCALVLSGPQEHTWLSMITDLWLGNWQGGRWLLGEEGLHLLILWKLSLLSCSKSVGPCGPYTKAKQSAVARLFLLKEIK